ncbi:MAG: hypothetical protein HOP33_04810 [Verrucomicrobia bacterium]|nr:hypothetical protein [Verrucomicrobiota bacterium]
MTIHVINSTRRGRVAAQAHTLPEAIIAVALVGMMLVSLYAGFSSGFAIVRSTRENLRATQILVQRMEAIRLYTWSELLYTNNFNNTTFVESYDPLGALSGNDGGTVYSGTIQLDVPSDLPAAYRDNMRLVTISVYWTNNLGGEPLTHSRRMQSSVARYGMQSYVYGK